MENYMIFATVVFTFAVIAGLILQIIDVVTKKHILYTLYEILDGGKPQNILLSQGQADSIAKIVKQLMEDKKG